MADDENQPGESASGAEAAPPKPKRQRLTDVQKIERHKQQIALLKTRGAKRSRQARNHELIVIGGAVIKAMREDEAFRWQVAAILQANVERSADREAVASWLSAT